MSFVIFLPSSIFSALVCFETALWMSSIAPVWEETCQSVIKPRSMSACWVVFSPRSRAIVLVRKCRQRSWDRQCPIVLRGGQRQIALGKRYILADCCVVLHYCQRCYLLLSGAVVVLQLDGGQNNWGVKFLGQRGYERGKSLSTTVT